MTPDDPIVSQVREVRDKHAVQFAYDLERIFRDIREKQRFVRSEIRSLLSSTFFRGTVTASGSQLAIGIPEAERRSESAALRARTVATASHQDRPYSVSQLRCAAHGCPRGIGIGPLG